MVREAVVAGQFYPASPQELKRQIEPFVDRAARKQDVIGIISPHAGYIYSGLVAVAVFSRIKIPETIVILGPNHTGVGPSVSLYKQGRWSTPFGEVEVDAKLAEAILKVSDLIKEDETAHAYEHSLEVQLPIMQYFRKDFTIVPIVLAVSGIDVYREIAEAIASSIKRTQKEVLIVASSDMTHYEPHEIAEKKDKLAIGAILRLDEKLLLRRVSEFDISMCGVVPATVMLMAAKSLGAKSAKLVKYQTSGDASGDYSAVVGYGGIIVK